MRVYNWVLLALLLSVVTACNTITGVGRDLKEAGGALENVGNN